MSKKSATKKKSIKEESEESEIEEYDEYEDKDEEYDEDEYDSDNSDGLEEDEEQEQEQEQEQETENETCMIDKTETNNNNNVEYVSKENRSTCNRLTKYELVRILGERTKQLNMGAKPMIKNYKTLSYERIAEEELKHNMIPFKIKRPLPNGKYEIWTLDELYKEHLLTLLEL